MHHSLHLNKSIVSNRQGEDNFDPFISKLNPHFPYTVVFVKDVGKYVEFYSKAFGFNLRRLDHSRRWEELQSGSTTIALTPVEQHETEVTDGMQIAEKDQPSHNVELCFTYFDVDAAYTAIGC